MRIRTKPRGQYHHGELRRALVDAAIAIVAKEGASALSLRAVARRVGVTATAAYRHFDDRAGLLAAAAEESVRLLAAEMRAADLRGRGAPPPDTPETRLRPLRASRSAPVDRGLGSFAAIGLAYVGFATSHPAHFRMLSLPEVADARMRPELLSAYEEAFGVLRVAIERCQRAGSVRGGDARGLAIAAWSAVHGASWLLVDGQIAAAGAATDPDRVARRVVRAIFEGLSATRGS
jgi:AcrR family transcriptional regulator